MSFSLGAKSLERLEGVHPLLVSVVKRAIKLTSVDFMVAEGLRSMARQEELYAMGRTKPGKKVTWTMNSKHLKQKDGYGHAVDLVPWVNGRADWNTLTNFDKVAEAMNQAALDLGVEIRWGADWDDDGVIRERGEYDSPHFELVKR